MRLILASTSPRRKELLSLLGVPFEVANPTFVEQIEPDVDPVRQVRFFAEEKARSCAEASPDALILGSDTLISFDKRILGKPSDLSQARAMLRALCGREHHVHTAVALHQSSSDVLDVGTESVTVWLRAFSEAELDDYLRSKESLGKAGAYSIQGLGGELVSRIEGDFPAVVGLPLRLVARMLEHRGMKVPVTAEVLYQSRPYPGWKQFG